jgi:CheY-like chemotaxis protein
MAVLGSLQLLKKRLPDDPRAQRLLNNAMLGADRGAALTQRLLSFARRQELKPEVVDIAELVSGMEDLLKRALGPLVQVGKSFPEGLPSIRADANQLELALLNLTINARDAMPLGGQLSIGATAETLDRDHPKLGLKPGRYVRISVSDTGCGMDEATLAKATEPFFTTKGPGKGTGLGLSMVHGLAAQSGGVLNVTSRVGEGTTVELWLPQVEENARTRSAHDARGAPQDIEPASPCTVLVVDDDALVSTGTAAMLEELGHTVIEASSGHAALETLKSGRPVDIVITDHAMPGMTGSQLATILRKDYPELPVVLATGYAEISSADESACSHRLSKPFRLEDLAMTLARIRGPAAAFPDKVVPLRFGK